MSVIVELGVPEVPFFGRLVNPIISKRGQIVPTTLFFDIFAPLVDRPQRQQNQCGTFEIGMGCIPRFCQLKKLNLVLQTTLYLQIFAANGNRGQTFVLVYIIVQYSKFFKRILKNLFRISIYLEAMTRRYHTSKTS